MDTVRVIVVTHNNKDVLPRCLRALNEQTYRKCKLTVVDNASSDGSLDVAKEYVPDAKRIHLNTNTGFAKANNMAFEQSEEEYVFLLNPDCFLGPNYIQEMVNVMKDNFKIASCTGVLYLNEACSKVDTSGLVLKPWHKIEERKEEGAGEVWGVSGAALFFRRSAVTELHQPLFDPWFHSYKEDADLAYRLRNAGWISWCTNQAKAIHLRGVGVNITRSERLLQNRYWSYRNHIWILLKNVSTKTWISKGIFILIYETLKALYLLVKEPKVLVKAWKDIIRVV